MALAASRTRAAAAVARAPRARPAVTARAAKLTLYGNPGSRSRIVEWYAEELGLGPDALAIKNLDMKEKREHKDPAYIKNVHPFGQVPALTVDGGGASSSSSSPPFSLFESGAILSYLAETNGQLSTPESRAVAAQWILFANSTLAQALFFDGPRERALPSILSSLDALLSPKNGGGPFITGPDFTVSDVAVGSYFAYIPRFLGDKVDIKPYANVSAYVERVLSRPAAKKTILA